MINVFMNVKDHALTFKQVDAFNKCVSCLKDILPEEVKYA